MRARMRAYLRLSIGPILYKFGKLGNPFFRVRIRLRPCPNESSGDDVPGGQCPRDVLS